MHVHLLWYVLALVALIIGIVYASISASNFNAVNNTESQQQAAAAIFFFFAGAILAVLAVVQQGRDAWNYKMKMMGQKHHIC